MSLYFENVVGVPVPISDLEFREGGGKKCFPFFLWDLLPIFLPLSE